MTWSTKPPTAVGGWFRSSLVELDSLQSFRGGIFHWKNRKFRLLPFVSEAGSEQSPNCPLGVFENCGRANGVGWTEGSPNCRWGFFKTQSILEFIHSFSAWWYRPLFHSSIYLQLRRISRKPLQRRSEERNSSTQVPSRTAPLLRRTNGFL